MSNSTFKAADKNSVCAALEHTIERAQKLLEEISNNSGVYDIEISGPDARFVKAALQYTAATVI